MTDGSNEVPENYGQWVNSITVLSGMGALSGAIITGLAIPSICFLIGFAIVFAMHDTRKRYWEFYRQQPTAAAKRRVVLIVLRHMYPGFILLFINMIIAGQPEVLSIFIDQQSC